MWNPSCHWQRFIVVPCFYVGEENHFVAMPRKRANTPSASSTSPKKKTKNAKAAANNPRRATVTDGFLKVIPPDPVRDATSLAVLQALDEHLRTKRIKNLIQQWCPKGLTEASVPGVRVINGNRFEVFVSAGSKETNAFDQLLRLLLEESPDLKQKFDVLQNKSVDEIRDMILDYAKAQAERDPRIGNNADNKYTFDNFSLLINYTACDRQYPHIDLLAPNVQCGLVITDKAPATVAYQTPHSVKTVQDLKLLLWKDLPDEVAQAIQNDTQCRRVLEQFGNTLHPNESLVEQKIPKLLQRGSLLSLTGSQMHSGPKSAKYRCVLFFSGWRKDSSVVSYDPDTQYFGPLLVADFLMQLFHVLSVEGRKYLVHKLAAVISTYKNLYRHLDDPAMRKLYTFRLFVVLVVSTCFFCFCDWFCVVFLLVGATQQGNFAMRSDGHNMAVVEKMNWFKSFAKGKVLSPS